MESLNIEQAKWINEEKLSQKKEDFKVSGITIAQCIPPIFENYCKLFHPFEMNLNESDTLIPDSEYRKKNLGKDLFQQYQETLQKYKSQNLKFISWHDIADKYGLVFYKEINVQTFSNKFKKIGWAKNLWFPKEGYLPRRILIQLLEILKSQTKNNEIYIYQRPPHTIHRNDKHSDLVLCEFEEVLIYFQNDFVGYLYSIDKSWIVFTDTDLPFSIIGGTRKLIDEIIKSNLEAIECDSNTRIDNNSDKLNKSSQ